MNIHDVLAQATDQVGKKVSDFAPEPEEIQEPDYNSDDFTDKQEAAETVFTGEAEPDTAPIVTKDILLKSAERWVNFISKGQKPFLISGYRKNLLKEGDQERITEAREQGVFDDKTTYERLRATDQGFAEVCRRIDRYTTACEGIEFTDDEKQMLIEPLAEVLEKYTKLTISPEGALVMAALMVMLPRIEPLFPNLFKGLKI